MAGGALTGDKRLKREGKADQGYGKIKQRWARYRQIERCGQLSPALGSILGERPTARRGEQPEPANPAPGGRNPRPRPT
jgi:hypothetical protein